MINKKNIKKKYSFSISKYGGEIAMGIITPEQYDYWNEKSNEELKEYVMGWQINEYEKEHNIPFKARMRNWFEFEDIHHTSGAEISDSQELYIEEYDTNDILLKQWVPIKLDAESIKKKGLKLSDYEFFDSNHKSVENKYYFWGRAVNEGSWYTEKIPFFEDLDIKKLTLNCSCVENWVICNGIKYKGMKEIVYFEEDMTGIETECDVCEGYQS